ncbi:SCO family protein [Jeotgalibacillus haloalkalitolerans]|uniref:SCO family protein n=1 Tax=Jeotgalibacillus haloalkalitolerans TaxID=3104292 RepID=A0ABU5KKP6_9BACL|nr:SCO family protein [Jeotgalibacillus sp. HH7-29]MDZ5711833.1 SCO family protein [Jeotgalibacillus sp. HH7-29]
MNKRMMTAGITAAILVSACSGGFEGNMEEELNAFEFTNHDGEQITNEDLEGTPVVANFIFTNCDTVCPPMTYNMTGLQEAIEDEGVENYRMVSFSVDPERDTPEALQEFMGRYDLNEDKWDFLTGYQFDTVSSLALESFQGLVVDDPSSDQMTHPTSIYLISPDGVVVKSYDGYQSVPEDEIIADLKALGDS